MLYVLYPDGSLLSTPPSCDLFMFKQTKISKKAFAVRMSTNACFGVFNVSKEERDNELILDVVDTISVSFYFVRHHIYWRSS